MSTELTTAREVFKALDGYPGMAELVGANYKQAFNWISTGQFPSRFFVVMSRALEKRGYTAPSSLWGMIESDRVAS